MNQPGYVVQFDGLSIPFEDVYTHDLNSSYYAQVFHTEKEDSGKKDKINIYLRDEEPVLKHDFNEWCKNKFLEESNEVCGGTSFDCSCNTSSRAPQIGGTDLSDDESNNDQSAVVKYSVEKNCFELLPDAQQNHSGEYVCKIDPSVFVLKDIDYIRAKCKWNFNCLIDFESNPKVIEHMRYLDLFTQCFTLRLLNERTLETNMGCSTCYKFQNNCIDSGIQVITTDQKAYSGTLKCIPEKESTCEPQKNSTVNPFQFKEMDLNQLKSFQQSGLHNIPGCNLGESYLNKTCDNEPVFENQFNSTRSKPRKFPKDPNCVDFNEHEIDRLSTSNERKTKIIKPCNRNVEFSSDHRSGVVQSKRSKGTLIKNVEKNTTSKDTELDCSLNHNDVNRLKNKSTSTSSSDMNKSLGAKKKLRLKTIYNTTSTKYESSQSQFISSISSYENEVEKTYLKYCKRISLEKVKKGKRAVSCETRRKQILKPSQSLVSENEKLDRVSTTLMNEFIKHSKKRNKNLTTDDSETFELFTSSVPSNSYFLDPELQKKMDEVEKDKHRPIIIIGLNCSKEKLRNKFKETKSKARLRRYIEGDNLCSPGRYAQSNSKDALLELDLSSNKTTTEYKRFKATLDNQINYTQVNQLKLQEMLLTTVESNVASNLSSNMKNETLLNDCTDSSSTVSLSSSAKAYKKCKRNKCKKCQNTDNALIIVDKHHASLNNSKASSPNLYAACWKRFCVIL